MLNLKSLTFYCSLIDHKIFLLIQLFIFKLWGFIFNTNYHRFKFFLPINLKTGEKLKYMFELFIQRDPSKKEFYKIIADPRYKCLLDLGANIGMVSHYFLKGWSNRYSIMVEPQKKCYIFLVKNFIYTNREIHHWGVGQDRGHKVLYKKTDMDVNASHWANIEKHYSFFSNMPKKSENVYITPIDDIYIPQKIDLVKINIEGGEPEAIAGMKNLIERDKPDILFDPHTDCNLTRIEEILYNYKITKIDKINYLAEPNV